MHALRNTDLNGDFSNVPQQMTEESLRGDTTFERS